LSSVFGIIAGEVVAKVKKEPRRRFSHQGDTGYQRLASTRHDTIVVGDEKKESNESLERAYLYSIAEFVPR
jgi:hypothetical protein